MIPETNSEEEGTDVGYDYCQGDTVTDDMGGDETDDIHENCIIDAEGF